MKSETSKRLMYRQIHDCIKKGFVKLCVFLHPLFFMPNPSWFYRGCRIVLYVGCRIVLQVPHFSCSYPQPCVDVIPCCFLYFIATDFTACTKNSELFTYDVNPLKPVTCLNTCLCIFITPAYSFKSLRVLLTVNAYTWHDCNWMSGN